MDDLPQGFLQSLSRNPEAMKRFCALPEGVKVQSSSLENGTLMLDMNAAFGEAIRASGTAGETLKIYALVNTFAQARGATAVLITVDGKVLESGHEIYDYAIEPNN